MTIQVISSLNIGQKIRSEVILIHLGIDSKRINFIDHSFGHVAYAYCSSQIFKNSYVASVVLLVTL